MINLQSNAEPRLIYCSDNTVFFLLASLNNTYSLHMYPNMYAAYLDAVFISSWFKTFMNIIIKSCTNALLILLQ